MASPKHNPGSVLEILTSPLFFLLFGAIVMLGSAFLIRAWNETRNDLTRAEIAQLKRRQRLLRQEHTDLRVRLARASALPQIEAKIHEFGLRLERPSEAQVMRVREPDWTLLPTNQTRRIAAGTTPSPRQTAPASRQPEPLLAGPGVAQTLPSP